MSTDYTAELGYGFRLSEELVDKLNNEEFEYDQSFDVIFCGNAYGEEMAVFICIKESIKSLSSWQDELGLLIKEKDLLANPRWKKKLLDLAKQYKITSPKLGWRLCYSVG